ncbi:MAG: helix-turn-helix domain-containing protein [Enterococcus casseliflavus]|nr:helix-turn-helix domain-containing protein [Enterococcus casseliflavus]
MDVIGVYKTSERSYREVANHLGINQPSLIVNWMKNFRLKGLDGLSKIKGCSPILSKKEEKEEINKPTP